MNIVLYQNKNAPWKHVVIRKYTYAKKFFFRFGSKLPNGTRIATWTQVSVNLFLLSFWKDNANLRFGIGWGIHQLSINFHR